MIFLVVQLDISCIQQGCRPGDRRVRRQQEDVFADFRPVRAERVPVAGPGHLRLFSTRTQAADYPAVTRHGASAGLHPRTTSGETDHPGQPALDAG